VTCKATLGVWRCDVDGRHRQHGATGEMGTRFLWTKKHDGDLLIQIDPERGLDPVSVDDLVDDVNDGRKAGRYGPSPGPMTHECMGMTDAEIGAWLNESGRTFGVLSSVGHRPARLLGRMFDARKFQTLGNKVRAKAYGRRFAIRRTD